MLSTPLRPVAPKVTAGSLDPLRVGAAIAELPIARNPVTAAATARMQRFRERIYISSRNTNSKPLLSAHQPIAKNQSCFAQVSKYRNEHMPFTGDAQ
jgi:hypothetical protein